MPDVNARHQILLEDGTPEGQRVAMAARRWAAALRQPLHPPRPDAAARLAHGLSAHAAALDLPMREVRILDRSDALQFLQSEAPARRDWLSRLAARAEELRRRLLPILARERHPLFLVSGDSLLLMTPCLPVAREDLETLLAGRPPAVWPPGTVRREIAEIFRHMGCALAAAMHPCPEAPEPFGHLLPAYEEGLIPAALDADGVFRLWTP